MAGQFDRQDLAIALVDEALRTLFARPRAHRPSPADALPDDTLPDDPALSPADRATSAALMRVNRAGEIAAQALYLGQALTARSDGARTHLLSAAAEERDHLAWCTDRIDALNGRTSLLDPFWFAGSACLGAAAGLAGDRASLGFVAETEAQVEAHLHDHLARLPAGDARSRAVLTRMAEDEARHGAEAGAAGGTPLPARVRQLMSVGGEVLRNLAFRV